MAPLCIENPNVGVNACYGNITIIINEYPEAGLTASISVQHIYYKHEFQQKNFTIVIIITGLHANF